MKINSPTDLVEEDLGGVTYYVQYRATSREALDANYKEDAERNRRNGLSKFADKMLAYPTEIEIVDEHSVNFNS